MSKGGGGDATQAAIDEEKRRQAQIDSTRKRIAGIFESPQREAQITDFIDALRQEQTTTLGRTKETNDRQLKFSLARNHQAGGSTQIDQFQNLNEAFSDALIEAERRAQSGGSRLRSLDQDAKLNLFNQAVSGLDTTTAASNAARTLQQNIGIAKGEGTSQGFDQFFGQFGDIRKSSIEADARRRADQQFGGPFDLSQLIKPQATGAGFASFGG